MTRACVAGLLLGVLAVAACTVEVQDSSPPDLLPMSTFQLTFRRAWYLATVLEVNESYVPSSPENFFKVRVDEVYAAYVPGAPEEPRWQPGDEVVVTAGADAQRLPGGAVQRQRVCGGKGVEVGAQVVFFRTANQNTRPAPGGATSYNVGVGHELYCVQDNAITVAANNVHFSLAETAHVALPVFRRFVDALQADVELETWRLQVVEGCRALSCGGAESCFFGVGCAEVGRQDVELPAGFYTGTRFRPDGTQDSAPPSRETPANP